MTRIAATVVATIMVAAGARAVTIDSTLTVTDATFILSDLHEGTSSASISGPVTLSGIGSGGATVSGKFSAIGVLTSAYSTATLNAPFTITFSSGATLTGTLTLPAAALFGDSTSLSGSVTITNGTDSYAGYTGWFPSLTSSSGGTVVSGFTVSFSGSGTITPPGSSGGGGGGGGSTTPTIAAVQDAGSYTNNVAQGSIFVVQGENLSGSGYVAFSFPLPTKSPDASAVEITFTPVAGGAGTDAYLIYTSNQNGVNQLAAILPSTLATGNYNVTVKYNGATTAPFSATVVARKPAIFTQDTSGTGLAVVQNFISQSQIDLNRFTTGTVQGTTISPAKKGEPLIAWGTGFGAVSFADNTGSPGYDFTRNGVNVQGIVGGVSIPAVYAGRVATLAGEDEVVFNLPSTVPTGCTVPFQISVNGTLSTSTFIAIADNDSNACDQPGYTTAKLQDLDNGETIDAGSFNLMQVQETVPQVGTVKVDSAGGAFTKITGFQLAAASQMNVSTSISGACTVVPVSGSSTVMGGGNLTNLDAGAITLSGPAGSNISNMALQQDASNGYSLSLGMEGLGIGLPGQENATLVAGTYTLAGAGGRDVGSFSVPITVGTPLSITLPSTVNRSQGLTLNWTGGNSSDYVEIMGYAGTSSGSGTNTTVDATEFICTTTAGPGTFTVPASVLMQLPAVSVSATGSGNTVGFLEVISGPTSKQFSPSYNGGTIGSTLSALIGTGNLAVAYQ